MRFELHLTGKEKTRLIKTIYDKGEGFRPIRCIGRTAKSISPSFQGSFKWSPAVRAFTYFLLKWAAWARCNNNSLTEPVVEGGKKSLAATLNYFFSRKEIPSRIFGNPDEFMSFFQIINPDLKTDGPVIITLDYDIFDPENIIVIVDGSELNDHNEINNIAENIKKEYFSEEIAMTPPNLSQREKEKVVFGNPPPQPELFIGREKDLINIKSILGLNNDQTNRSYQNKSVVIRGWPGIGKSTFVAAIANDRDIINYFTEGILWTSLGQTPNVISEISHWIRIVNNDKHVYLPDITQAVTLLRKLVSSRKMLLIVDDVWNTAHAMTFIMGSDFPKVIFTTRLPFVAQSLSDESNKTYVLEQLNEKYSLELLSKHVPEIILKFPEESKELVRELGGLPLAIRVAGKLLASESVHQWGVEHLLRELRDDSKAIIQSEAPSDMSDIAGETTPTVAALLQKSTDKLDLKTRRCFSALGPFAPKPATFDIDAMAFVWETDDPKPIVRELVSRGLLEPFGAKNYQMHALLVAHAKYLLHFMEELKHE